MAIRDGHTDELISRKAVSLFKGLTCMGAILTVVRLFCPQPFSSFFKFIYGNINTIMKGSERLL